MSLRQRPSYGRESRRIQREQGRRGPTHTANALELAPKVRVNAVAPGLVKTKFARVLWEGREEEAAAAYPLGRLGEPEDVAGIACFLLSDDASWITGATVVVDGGVLLAQPE